MKQQKEPLDFPRQLIKGRIAEVVFEQMFREAGDFAILRFGYEYTLPELAQYQKSYRDNAKADKVMETVRHAPDFVLASKEKGIVFLVEVKYRSEVRAVEMLKLAKSAVNRWDPSWIFVASPETFYFSSCHEIINASGVIKELSVGWVAEDIQKRYLGLLHEFERCAKR